MYALVFFSVSAICFFGGLISLIMALTIDANGLQEEHFKNAVIYGLIAPITMVAAVRLFFKWYEKSGGSSETEEEKIERLDQLQQKARYIGVQSMIQSVWGALATITVFILRGTDPVLAIASGVLFFVFGIVVTAISLNRTTTNWARLAGLTGFVVFLGWQIALVVTLFVIVVIVQFGG